MGRQRLRRPFQPRFEELAPSPQVEAPKRVTVEVIGDGVPEMATPTACRACGAPMIWFKTARNLRNLPMDPGFEVRSTTMWPERTATLHGTPHFLSCPEADRFRKRS